MELAIDSRRVNDVTGDQLQQYTREHHEAEYVLVDVRQPEEYAQGHIPGARLVPLGEMEARAKELQALGERTVVFYCRSGGRSARAANWAKIRLGVPKVVNLLGGYASYQGLTLADFPRLKAFAAAGSTEELLRQALDLEKGTHNLYELLAREYTSGVLAEVIGRLAEAEVAHGRAIHNILTQLVPGSVGEFEALFEGLPGELIESGESYDAVLARARALGDQGPPMLLELVLEIELTAYDLYRNLAAAAPSQVVEAALTSLAQQEKQHTDSVLGAFGQLASQGAL